MIALNRNRQAVPDVFFGDGRRRREKKLLEDRRKLHRGDVDKMPWSSNYWKDAKPQLKNETTGKCAYCEADTDTTYYGDVEHFRPKSEYWWLAYCYDNYLYSCSRCNAEYKGQKFPRRGAKLDSPRVTRNTTDARIDELKGTLAPDPLRASADDPTDVANRAWADEDPGLINPYLENPEGLLMFEVDDVNAEVLVSPQPADEHSEWRVGETINVLGLNRENVTGTRYREYVDVKRFRDIYIALEEDNPARAFAEEGLRDAIDAATPFAGMARFFVNEIWGLNIA